MQTLVDVSQCVGLLDLGGFLIGKSLFESTVDLCVACVPLVPLGGVVPVVAVLVEEALAYLAHLTVGVAHGRVTLADGCQYLHGFGVAAHAPGFKDSLIVGGIARIHTAEFSITHFIVEVNRSAAHGGVIQ